MCFLFLLLNNFRLINNLFTEEVDFNSNNSSTALPDQDS